MSFVRVHNKTVRDAAKKRIEHLEGLKNIDSRDHENTIELLKKLIAKVDVNFESNINLSDHDFVLIQKAL